VLEAVLVFLKGEKREDTCDLQELAKIPDIQASPHWIK